MSFSSSLANLLFEMENIAIRIFSLIPMDDLLSLASCSSDLKAAFEARLTIQGIQTIESRLDCNPEDLQTLLLDSYALLTEVSTDVLVPWDRFRLIEIFLHNKNFRRVEFVKDEKSSASRTLYAHGRLPKVSVTAAPASSFWLPFLKFQGTMSANFVSATTVFTMYPELTFNRLNLMRNTALHLVAEHDIEHTRAQRLGFESFRHNGFRQTSGVLEYCPGLVRTLRGARGIMAIPWGHLPDQCARYEDFYRTAFVRGFSDDFFACGWQFATWCSNDSCDFRRLMNLPGLDSM
ncbi:hypothetical protein AAF712_016059 [Marasmius tenuissimus]|uniref:F-box domain-containing protein n=1 Tax=Marasmius tenuissimus TaxID=585030 RepID=A0ABR2Z7S2_9AGAR